MTAIEATFVRAQTMVDGTLRLIVDVEPRDAVAAFGLFGQPGTALALAALKPGAQPEPEPERPKGGHLAVLAARWCESPIFWRFLDSHGFPTSNAAEAANHVRSYCGVDSRAELDHNGSAALIFHSDFRLPYMKWRSTNGANAPMQECV